MVKFPFDLVRVLSISEESKTFLTEVGLPLQIVLPGTTLILLPVTSSVEPVVSKCKLLEKINRFRLIAETPFSGNGNYLALDERNGGSIVYHTYNNLKTGYAYFMNTTVAQFAECLLAYREWVENGENANQNELCLFASTLEQIDAAALAYTADERGEITMNYWATVLQSLEVAMTE